jgi:predicted RNA-binding Zn-ribbon protein involved in translation (DUF1610 family)
LREREEPDMKENETRNISEFHPVDGFKCEKCGIDLRDWSRIEFDDSDEFVHEFEFKFCPNCGKKIIEEESDDGE